MHDRFQDFLGADPLFCAGQNGLFGIQADNVFNLVFNARNVRAGQIDFIDYRNDFEIMIQCKVRVCKRLSFNALGGVDALITRGVSLLLDVPRVAQGVQAFDRTQPEIGRDAESRAQVCASHSTMKVLIAGAYR